MAIRSVAGVAASVPVGAIAKPMTMHKIAASDFALGKRNQNTRESPQSSNDLCLRCEVIGRFYQFLPSKKRNQFLANLSKHFQSSRSLERFSAEILSRVIVLERSTRRTLQDFRQRLQSS